MTTCPHCHQPLPPPMIRFADLAWLRELAARDQVPGAETLGPHELLAPDHEESDDVNY
jgi:hypothetical protein